MEGPSKHCFLLRPVEEEEKIYFRPKVGFGDLTATVLSKSYASFSVPEKSEGFDEIKFAWDTEKKSKDYLRKWMLETKATTRIEDLQPSKEFTDKHAASWMCLVRKNDIPNTPFVG